MTEDPKKVYENLRDRLALDEKETEILAILSGVAPALALVAEVLSAAWFNRVRLSSSAIADESPAAPGLLSF
jgi:hypothetical protein